MADALTNIKKTAPVAIPQYLGTLQFVLDGDLSQRLNITTSDGGGTLTDEKIEPGAGETVTVTVSVKGRLE